MKFAISSILFIILFILMSNPVMMALKPFIPTETLIIENDKWKVFKTENMAVKTINQKKVYQLNEAAENNISAIDLFLNFESPLKNIPNYKVISANFELNKYKNVNGSYSGKFYYSDNYISLLPLDTSIFAPGNVPGSFTIEFWLYFYKNYDNQYVIKYMGNNLSDEKDKNNYGFSIYTKNNRLIYQFDNFFWSDNNEPHSVEINEEVDIQLYKWEHHAVSFNIMNGKMATYKNSIEQDVKWITADSRHLSTIYNPKVKEELSTPILIGQNAICSLDNLKISKDAIDGYYLKKYQNKESYIITDIYKFSDNISALRKLSFSYDSPGYSSVKLAYRLSDQYFLPDDLDIPWVSIQNNIENFPENYNSGKYIQFKVTANPYEDSEEPITINSIKLDYGVDNDPYVPVLANISALDEKIQVTWIPSPEDDIAGYEIYYGSRVGDYVSSDAKEGKSPIFVTATNTGDIKPISFILTGLINEKPYFISIRNVDKNRHKSPFSREAYARPSSIYNDNKYSVGR
jgi:hypothetical protein